MTHDLGKWLTVPYAFDQAVKAANTILEYHRPKGPIVEPVLSPRDMDAGVEKTAMEPQAARALINEFIRNVGEETAVR